ncbi:hypothetical protein HAX54_017524 [Datura stramonium]|uniref:Uncharacterized protein n=1 Tax=Datura stramonium TaxID=4076 RepID=A0ABS8UKV5_DATST|nr:hypothetical protein [Datura stramonium]
MLFEKWFEKYMNSMVRIVAWSVQTVADSAVEILPLISGQPDVLEANDAEVVPEIQKLAMTHSVAAEVLFVKNIENVIEEKLPRSWDFAGVETVVKYTSRSMRTKWNIFVSDKNKGQFMKFNSNPPGFTNYLDGGLGTLIPVVSD